MRSIGETQCLVLHHFLFSAGFGAGIQLDFNVKKGISDRELTHEYNAPTVNYFHSVEKYTKLNIGGWVGYRLLDNLGIGFCVFFRTFYSNFDRTYIDLTGGPSTEEYTRYNLTEERLKLGVSVTYKPFSFLRFTFEGFIVHKRMVEAFMFFENEWINLGLRLKLVFLPINDILFIYTNISCYTHTGRNYDRIVVGDPLQPDKTRTWTKEKNFKISFIIDYWVLPAKLYLRAGGFFENKIYDETTRYLLSRRDELYTFFIRLSNRHRGKS